MFPVGKDKNCIRIFEIGWDVLTEKIVSEKNILKLLGLFISAPRLTQSISLGYCLSICWGGGIPAEHYAFETRLSCVYVCVCVSSSYWAGQEIPGS